MYTWKEECVFVLEQLGGHAYLRDIYAKFLQVHRREVPKSYKQSIQDALEKGSQESTKFDGKALFYMIDGKNKGHYGLIEQKNCSLDLTADDDEFSEGKELLKLHLTRERNQYLIARSKQKFKDEHGGRLYCEICGFDFAEVYGGLGNGFIEAHHTKPISEMKPDEKTKVEDMLMLCSNCHSTIHRRKPWATKKDIKEILKQ